MVSRQSIYSINTISLTYPRGTKPSLSQVSFDIYEGQCLGLIGANGAGKTSLISIIAGILKPSAGKCSFVDNRGNCKTKIGLVPQNIALYEELTGLENLRYFGALYNIPSSHLSGIIDEKLKEFGLYDKRDELLSTYSGGMKRRLNILAGILHKPKLIILDEPLVGVDVRSRNIILTAFKNLRESGASLVYTSHHMKEVEELCDQIVILEQGKVVQIGAPKVLLAAEPDCDDLYELFCKYSLPETM